MIHASNGTQNGALAPGGPAPARRHGAELAAAALAAVCFLNVLPNDFCYDDDAIVRVNPKVNAAGRWLEIWTTDHWSGASEAPASRDLLYRPLSLCSYRLIRVLFGADPFAQHLANVVLHALVCVLTARLCRHVGGSGPAAFAAGAVFAVLPIHTEVVAAVVGRDDLLAALGITAALLAHRRSMLASTLRAKTAWRVAAMLGALGAMTSKEVGITAVALLVLFDAYWHGRLGGSRGGGWWSRSTVLRLAYLPAVPAAYLALRYQALDGRLYQSPPLTKTVNVLVDAPPWQHALGVVQLWGMYWSKTVWPAVLSVKYSINGIRLATGPMDGHVLIGAGALVGLVIASSAAWRKGIRAVAVLSLAIVISYLPTSNAFPLIQVFFAERIWYVPSVFIAVLAALGAARWLRGRAPWVVFALILSAMTVRCWARNAEWHDNGTLYAAACRDQRDSAGALELYGRWLVNQGRYSRGVQLLDRAVEIDPGFTAAHRALGGAHMRAGDLRGALRHLQIAEMQVPGHPATATALRRVTRELVERDTELARLRREADAERAGVDAEIALVRGLRNLGLVHKALTRLRSAEDRFAASADWQAEYAVTLVYLNKRDEAVERYRKSLALSPDDAGRAVELAMLLLERRENGDLEEARRWADHAAALAPDLPTVLACRAELLALSGDLAGAIALFDRAIDLLPRDSPRRRVFEQRARALGR